MKKNISEKIKFDIDLTPLLDVIFIVLMVVMCKVNLNNAAEAAEAPGAEISESSEEAISESMKEKLLEELQLDYGWEPNGEYHYFYNNHYWAEKELPF